MTFVSVYRYACRYANSNKSSSTFRSALEQAFKFQYGLLKLKLEYNALPQVSFQISMPFISNDRSEKILDYYTKRQLILELQSKPPLVELKHMVTSCKWKIRQTIISSIIVFNFSVCTT